jgi:hypothetical protein
MTSEKLQSLQQLIYFFILTKDINIQIEIKEIIKNLSEIETQTLEQECRVLLPKTYKQFITANQLKKNMENIELVVDLNIPIDIFNWYSLFSCIGHFEDTFLLVNYLTFQRKRLISINKWEEKIDKTIVLPIRSQFSKTKWIDIVYNILDNDLFKLVPELSLG